MTKKEAIEELLTFDHCFMTPEGAERICKPFGLTPRLYEMEDNRSNFKGLRLEGVNPKTGKEFQEGDTSSGVASDSLAVQIADHLGIDYVEMFGRGSRLRSVCEAILKSLKN